MAIGRPKVFPQLWDRDQMQTWLDEGLSPGSVAKLLGCTPSAVLGARHKLLGVTKGTRDAYLDRRLRRRRLNYGNRQTVEVGAPNAHDLTARMDLYAPFSETTSYNRWVRGPAPADEHVEWQKCYWLGMSITHLLHEEPEP